MACHALAAQTVEVLVRGWKKKKGVQHVTSSFLLESIEYRRCKKCKGEKTIKEKTRQEIFIEKGMTDRQRIVLAGAGDQEVFVPNVSILCVFLKEL